MKIRFFFLLSLFPILVFADPYLQNNPYNPQGSPYHNSPYSQKNSPYAPDSSKNKYPFQHYQKYDNNPYESNCYDQPANAPCYTYKQDEFGYTITPKKDSSSATHGSNPNNPYPSASPPQNKP